MSACRAWPFKDVWGLFSETAEIKCYAQARDERINRRGMVERRVFPEGRAGVLVAGQGRGAPVSAAVMVYDNRARLLPRRRHPARFPSRFPSSTCFCFIA